MPKIATLLFIICGSLVSGQTHSKETIVMQTPYGTMKIKLFEETPLHKENFLKLVREKNFDSLLFHRVINQFMIQGGDPLSRRAKPGDSLGHGDLGYLVPAEFRPDIFHVKGRLCAARDNDDVNPEQKSSASQFYIVMGKPRSMEDLKKYEDRINRNRYRKAERALRETPNGLALFAELDSLRKYGRTDTTDVLGRIELMVKNFDKRPLFRFTREQISAYTTTGGTPHLDSSYTVFGEVVEGLEVIDKIAGVQTDKRDRPLQDIRMKVWIAEE